MLKETVVSYFKKLSYLSLGETMETGEGPVGITGLWQRFEPSTSRMAVMLNRLSDGINQCFINSYNI